jgi:hypothetical protein
MSDKEAHAYSSPEPEHILEMDRDAFQAAFGEPVERFTDINKWSEGDDVARHYARLSREIQEADQQEKRAYGQLRNILYPQVFKRGKAPHAGCYQATLQQIESIHKKLLFNGSVEACAGLSLAHDSLALMIIQLTVALVSYDGRQGTWRQNLYRRDLRMQGLDSQEELLALLERRSSRERIDLNQQRDMLSKLAMRGLLEYGERATLLERAQAPWRMGYGNPIPYEILTGAGLVVDGDMPLLRQGMTMLEALLNGENKRWVFVSKSLRNRLWLTFGAALKPLEFAIVATLENSLYDIAEGHLPQGIQEEVFQFIERVGKDIVIGIYRASSQAPACVFYAHKDSAHEAALIALADSMLQEHRGSPMLLDLARMICNVTFGVETFNATIQQASIEANILYQTPGAWDDR